MARTYVPTLVVFANLILVYVAKHREKIRQNLSTEADALLDVLLTTLQSLVDLITLPTED